MLTARKKKYLKGWLTRRLSELLGKDRRTFNDMTEYAVKAPDEIEQASMELDRGLTLHMSEREWNLIRKIEDALERLDKGTFGICEECGEEISEKRLMARPVTTLSIECKREQEALEKRGALNY
jgi:DnaK suppressor protein